VGAAVYRKLYRRLRQIYKSHAELDLTSRPIANAFFRKRGRLLILAAAKVGGIHANSHYRANYL